MACASLIFIMLIGNIGSFVLPNYKVFAQEASETLEIPEITIEGDPNQGFRNFRDT